MILPSRFQWKSWWTALTVLALGIIIYGIYIVGSYVLAAISALQAVVIPLAVAGILAYLLDPVVTWLTRRKIPRLGAVVIVFATVLAVIVSMILWVVPSIHRQSDSFRSNLPRYSQNVQALFKSSIENARRFAARFQSPEEVEQTDPFNAAIQDATNKGITAVQEKAAELLSNSGGIIMKGVGGALGVFGFLLSLVLVPIFLFFFLNDGPQIASTWSNYLPLRASPLKSEMVSLISEINTYLISFFRGQLLVSLIDGLLIGTALLVMRLDFALLIGLLVGILGIIPYAGMLICWVPAVLIAAAQFNDWQHPLAVTIIFIVMNQLEGLLVAPKIVGESVGLHPLTVIISVLAWSIVLGGLLGALLAIPLTATLKVVLKRYFWDRDPSAPTPPGLSPAPPG